MSLIHIRFFEGRELWEKLKLSVRYIYAMAKSKDEKIVLVKKNPFDDENTELYELPEQDMEVIRRYIRDWKSSDFHLLYSKTFS